MSTPSSSPGQLQDFRGLIWPTWSSEPAEIDPWQFKLIILFSLAAIQASKEHAKEVGLLHFEWAMVREINDSSSQRSHLTNLLGPDHNGGGAKEPAHWRKEQVGHCIPWGMSYAVVTFMLWPCENARAGTLLLRCTLKGLCHCTRLLASLEATP